MVWSKLYRLDTSDTEWEVAHLFEHLVIRRFYSTLKKIDIQSQLIAWTGGETFEGMIFIDTLFYTAELAAEFEKYITRLPEFSDSEILYSIATLEAEGRIILSIHDMTALRKEINKLHVREWNAPIVSFKQEDIPKSAILVEKRSAKDFRSIVIIVKIENLTADEQKLLLRAHILLRDIVYDLLGPIGSIYQDSDTPLIRHEEDMAFMLGVTTSRNTSLKQIRERLSSAILTDVLDLEKTLKSHFTIFAGEPLWQNAPIDYFRQTGIITTNQEIASLATTDRMKSIIDKTSFEVRRMTAEDRVHLH